MTTDLLQRQDGLGQAVGRSMVAVAISTVGLLILRVVVTSLPMIKNVAPLGDAGVSPLVLVKAAPQLDLAPPPGVPADRAPEWTRP